MLGLIKQAALEATGSQNPVEIFEAVVSKPPPDLTIKLKGNDGQVIPKQLLIVSEWLTNHIRKVKLSTTKITDEETIDGYKPHQHDLTSIVLDEAVLEFLNELKEGERVMVGRYAGGQKFYIFDRYKQY